MLEYHTDALTVFGDVQLFVRHILSLEQHLPGIRGLQKIQAPQEGGLSAAGGADDGYNLIFVEADVDALQDLQLMKFFFKVNNPENFPLIFHETSSFPPEIQPGR